MFFISFKISIRFLFLFIKPPGIYFSMHTFFAHWIVALSFINVFFFQRSFTTCVWPVSSCNISVIIHSLLFTQTNQSKIKHYAMQTYNTNTKEKDQLLKQTIIVVNNSGYFDWLQTLVWTIILQ